MISHGVVQCPSLVPLGVGEVVARVVVQLVDLVRVHGHRGVVHASRHEHHVVDDSSSETMEWLG